MSSLRKISRSRNFMNTGITLSIAIGDEVSTVDALDAIELAFGEFDRIVKLYTRFNDTSELSKLNAASKTGPSWYPVSKEFQFLIQTMLDLAAQSKGAFDPTIIDFLEEYGYDKHYNFRKLEEDNLTSRISTLASTRPSWREIEVRPLEVKLAQGQRLDLGGIGKGYAMDCAAAHLAQFKNYLINAGGDLICQGVNEMGEPWQLALKHKHEDQEIIIGKFQAEKPESPVALGCSGSWARKVKDFHHLLHPSSGKPVAELATVFVTAPTAMLADGWATALFVGGKELLPVIPKGYEAVLVSHDGQITGTPALIEKLFPK